MKRFIFLVLLLFLLSKISPVQADAAPPQQPPGANPNAMAESTQVRMVAETVLINVRANAPEGSFGVADVTATFEMLETGSSDESILVGFPVGSNNGYGQPTEISNFKVYVNGTAVESEETSGEDPYYSDISSLWRQFPVTFPAGKTVELKVTYTLEGTGFTTNQVWFNYIFSTGAGWKDTIGTADLIIRLPYEVTPENFVTNNNPDYGSTTPGWEIDGNEIHWHFSELEPTEADNFEVVIVSPLLWQHLLEDKAAVAQYPNDSELWGHMGKSFKELLYGNKERGFRTFGITTDPGAQMVFEDAKLGYEMALNLSPDDALWHAGYAELLGYYAWWADMEGMDTRQEAVQAISEIKLALELAPSDATVQQIASEILYYFPDGITRNGNLYDYPWLTATPILPAVSLATDATPAPGETAATIITATQTPFAEVQPSATPGVASKPLLPICGGVMLLPLLWLLVRRIHSAG